MISSDFDQMILLISYLCHFFPRFLLSENPDSSFDIANRYFSAITASGGIVQQVLASRPEKNTAARRGGARKDGGGRGEIDEEKEDANWSGLVASNSAC